MATAPVTKVSVVAIVGERSVYEHPFDSTRPPTVRFLSKMDIAAVIAAGRGWDGKAQMYTSLASIIRPFVSPSQVQKALFEAVRDGDIVQVSGDHWAARRQNGINKNATYYISNEAKDLLIEKEDRRTRDAISEAAAKWATETLIERHREEHTGLRLQYVAEHPAQDAADRW